MLEYLYKEGEAACSKEPLKVRLDGRIIGEIRKMAGGYQYFPKGQKVGGEVFGSVSEVQRSLRTDDTLPAIPTVAEQTGEMK